MHVYITLHIPEQLIISQYKHAQRIVDLISERTESIGHPCSIQDGVVECCIELSRLHKRAVLVR